MPQPKSFVIQVLVTGENSDGTFNTILRSYFDGVVLTKPLLANLGDQIAWLVQLQLPGARRSLPYTLQFSKDTFFGVSSLDVPKGGLSPYLPVRPLQDIVSYSLSISGLGCIFDPEIQSGSDYASISVAIIKTFTVVWDTAANTMSYASGVGGVPSPFPPGGVQLTVGDKVTFVATAGGAVDSFTITFTNSANGWLTPFEPNHQSLSASPASSATIGPKPVSDHVDSGASFPFTASINVNGSPIVFYGDPNVKFTL
jgi:hypothetical protein